LLDATVCGTANFRSLATLGMTTDGKYQSRSEFSGWMPRAGMAQKVASNFSFKHGRSQSTKFPYRPVGLGNTFTWGNLTSSQTVKPGPSKPSSASRRSASRNGRDPGSTIILEGFSLLSPKPIRGYTFYQIGVLGSRIPLDNLRRMYAFVGGPRRAPLAGSPNPGNPNG
jgi:hypothetical protein